MKILFCSEMYREGLRQLRLQLPEHEIAVCSSGSVANHLADVDVLVPTVANIDEALIERGRFGLVQQYGVGLERVDTAAATRAGVWVARVPSAGTGNAESVAEHAVMLMLALARRLDEARRAMNERLLGEPVGATLLGKTACIVGLGDIGLALATRLQPFGMRLTAVRARPEQGAPPNSTIARVYGPHQLHSALAEADFVIVCVKYDVRSNHHLIDSKALAAMKPGAFLVNIARGGLVDPAALQEALASGQLAGAGLDVFWEEPVDASHPIFSHNVIATPHIAGVTDTSFAGIAQVVVDNIRRFGRGEAPLYAVNTVSAPRRGW